MAWVTLTYLIPNLVVEKINCMIIKTREMMFLTWCWGNSENSESSFRLLIWTDLPMSLRGSKEIQHTLFQSCVQLLFFILSSYCRKLTPLLVLNSYLMYIIFFKCKGSIKVVICCLYSILSSRPNEYFHPDPTWLSPCRSGVIIIRLESNYQLKLYLFAGA